MGPAQGCSPPAQSMAQWQLPPIPAPQTPASPPNSGTKSTGTRAELRRHAIHLGPPKAKFPHAGPPRGTKDMSPTSSTSSSRQMPTSQMPTHTQQETESEPGVHHATPCKATAVCTATLEPLWAAGHTPQPHTARTGAHLLERRGRQGPCSQATFFPAGWVSPPFSPELGSLIKNPSPPQWNPTSLVQQVPWASGSCRHAHSWAPPVCGAAGPQLPNRKTSREGC